MAIMGLSTLLSCGTMTGPVLALVPDAADDASDAANDNGVFEASAPPNSGCNGIGCGGAGTGGTQGPGAGQGRM